MLLVRGEAAGEMAWVFVKINSDGKLELPSKQLSFPEMKQLLRSVADSKEVGKWKFDGKTITTVELFRQFRMAFAQAQAVEAFMFIFVILFCTLFFAGLFRMVSSKVLPGFTFGMLWNSAVYAAFPVLLVASAFPALQLPGKYLYTVMFLLGWMVYLCFILRSLILFSVENDDKKEEALNE
jgi:hypothetical protein